MSRLDVGSFLRSWHFLIAWGQPTVGMLFLRVLALADLLSGLASGCVTSEKASTCSQEWAEGDSWYAVGYTAQRSGLCEAFHQLFITISLDPVHTSAFMESIIVLTIKSMVWKTKNEKARIMTCNISSTRKSRRERIMDGGTFTSNHKWDLELSTSLENPLRQKKCIFNATLVCVVATPTLQGPVETKTVGRGVIL